jgi:hypothetical protein
MLDAKIPPAKVSIDKRDLDTGDEVPGATLRLTGVDKDNKTINFTKGVLETASSDQIVKDSGEYLEWKSGNKPSTVTLEDGTYTLEEITPPDGYQTTTNITFTVKDGKVTSVDNVTTDSNDITMLDAKIPPTTDISDSDTIGAVKICKHDVYGNELSGAELTLTGVDNDGKPIVFTDAKIRLGEGAEILSTSTDSMLVWKSGETPTTIMGIGDGTYVLKETAAPDGYLVATDITFVVENGIVTESSSTITSQNVITMTDEAIDTTETSETTSTTSETTTSTTSTTTTETTTETTSTTAPSTASSSDSPRTGSTGVGVALGLMALSAMTAFALRKKDDDDE